MLASKSTLLSRARSVATPRAAEPLRLTVPRAGLYIYAATC